MWQIVTSESGFEGIQSEFILAGTCVGLAAHYLCIIRSEHETSLGECEIVGLRWLGVGLLLSGGEFGKEEG
jgi:hypothetical protein